MREQSPSDIYHVMARGNWKQITFNDDVEREKFLQLLAIEKEKYEIELHCYCLMDNHFHLLIKAQPDEMSFFMRDLQAAYARFYNWKTVGSGTCFRGCIRASRLTRTSITAVHFGIFCEIRRLQAFAKRRSTSGAVTRILSFWEA